MKDSNRVSKIGFDQVDHVRASNKILLLEVGFFCFADVVGYFSAADDKQVTFSQGFIQLGLLLLIRRPFFCNLDILTLHFFTQPVHDGLQIKQGRFAV